MSTDAEKIRTLRNTLRLTQKKLAVSLNLSLAAISMIECGKNTISPHIRELIKNNYNYDIDKQCFIMEKEYVITTSDIIPIPFYNVKAAANPKGLLLPDYTEKEALFFDKRWLKNTLGVNPYNCSIIYAEGDSMNSGMNRNDDIKNGDLLLVDNSNINIINNKTYIVELVTSGEILVKKVNRSITGEITLISNNPIYSPRKITEADNALILGKVVWNGSKENF